MGKNELRAYADAVEITKAAMSSETLYTPEEAAKFIQAVHDKLLELLEKSES